MRTVTAAITMVAHHGVPDQTWMCSTSHSMNAVGPQPKSRPSSFRYPIRSGMAGSSVAASRDEGVIASDGVTLVALELTASLVGMAARDEVELNRAKGFELSIGLCVGKAGLHRGWKSF